MTLNPLLAALAPAGGSEFLAHELPLSAQYPEMIGAEFDPDLWLDPSLPATADWRVHDVEDDLDEIDLAESLKGEDDDWLGDEIEEWLGEDDDDDFGEDDDDFGEDDEFGWSWFTRERNARLAEAGASPAPLHWRRRRRLIAIMPYMNFRHLRRISRNPFRGRRVRAAAMREIARRQEGGERLYYDEETVPYWAEDAQYIDPRSPTYRVRQLYYEQVPQVRRVTTRGPVVQVVTPQTASSQRFDFRPGTIVRRRHPAVQTVVAPTPVVRRVGPPRAAVPARAAVPVTRHVGPRGGVHRTWTGPRGGTHHTRVGPAGRVKHTRVGPAGRTKTTIRRLNGSFGADQVEGFTLTPKLGSAMWAHPVKTSLVLGGVYAVGAAIGADRTLGAFAAIGDTLRGLFQGR